MSEFQQTWERLAQRGHDLGVDPVILRCFFMEGAMAGFNMAQAGVCRISFSNELQAFVDVSRLMVDSRKEASS